MNLPTFLPIQSNSIGGTISVVPPLSFGKIYSSLVSHPLSLGINYHEVIDVMCRKKLSPVRRKLRKYTVVLLIAAVLFTIYFETAIKVQLKDVMIREMRTLSEKSVSQAVDEYLADHTDTGQKMCDIIYNKGSVAAISTNTVYVNAVKTAVSRRAQEIIDEASHKQGVAAHLGNFTGLVWLSGLGPVIRFPVDSAQTVSCEFQSSFESAGINQTVHHITITVYVDLLLYGPIRIGETVSTESTFEIAQTVIVGSVPSYSGVVSY